MVKILGIETSCDETSVAIVTDKKEILVNLVYSQIKEHKLFGGVVPEIAARSHIDNLDKMIIAALDETKLSFNDINAIAVTSGPGLIGGLIVGVVTAKAMAHVLNKPLLSINHLEGHALAPRLTEDLEFPYLLLLISGGHCQILIVENQGKYKILGSTIDDALGEAFDKIAKMMGLGYPGGPIIEQRAKLGNPHKYKLPLAMTKREGCDFSFSGLKTAVKNLITQIQKDRNSLDNQEINDICASFQLTAISIIWDRLTNAFEIYNKLHPQSKKLVVSGGVAANQYIKEKINDLCKENNFQAFYPPIKLCTDNAAMIAWVGVEKYTQNIHDNLLEIEPRARWPLTEI